MDFFLWDSAEIILDFFSVGIWVSVCGTMGIEKSLHVGGHE